MPIRTKLLILLSTSFPLRPSSAFRVGRYFRQPLTAFSSTAVSHGRHLPLSVFPKLGFWNREASQFNTQAVVKEGRGELAASLTESKDPHPWPEWSKLVELLLEKGYSDRGKAAGHDDDSFLVDEDLPDEFLKAAGACLGFSRERPDILRLLSKRNVEAVVLNGSPFLFKNGENSASRMRLFINAEGNNELDLGKAESVDIMRYLLSYVYGPLSLSAGRNLKVDEPAERSVRKLLVELFNLSNTVWKPKSTDATKIEPPLSNGHVSGPSEQYIDSRTGSWTSPKDTVNSAQPSRDSLSYSSTFYGRPPTNSCQPPGNSWNSYKTSYAGYSMNSIQPSNTSWSNRNTPYGGSFSNSSEPPSDRNTPYGGRSASSTQPSGNSWTNSNSSCGGFTPNSSQPHKSAKSTQPSSSSWNNNSTSNYEANRNPSHLSSNAWYNNRESWGSGFPPGNSVTVDLPKQVETQNACENGSFGFSGKSLEGSCVKEPDPLDMSEEAKAERWFRRVAQIKDIQELSQIPDEDFPQIMPMRKGVNRFVISKRKTPLERRLASQQYKRNLPVVSSEPEKEPTEGST